MFIRFDMTDKEFGGLSQGSSCCNILVDVKNGTELWFTGVCDDFNWCQMATRPCCFEFSGMVNLTLSAMCCINFVSKLVSV